jgi:hypothetical protein
MRNSEIFHKIIGTILIAIGILSYPLPIPGSTFLVVLGLSWLLGRRQALHFIKKCINWAKNLIQ